MLRSAKLSYLDIDRNRFLNESEISIKEGSISFLLGPNGCGKSSLLRALTGLSFKHLHSDLHWSKKWDQIGYLDQNYLKSLDPWKPIARSFHLDGFLHSQIPQILSQFELSENKTDIASLSGGKQQRLALLSQLSCIKDPKNSIILLDEPLSAQFDDFKSFAMEFFESLAQSGLTFIIVTHDRDVIPQNATINRFIEVKNSSHKFSLSKSTSEV